MEKHRFNFKSILIACISLLFAALLIIAYVIHDHLTQPLISASKKPITIQIDKNTSASQFVHALKAKGLIPSSRLILLLIRAQGLSNHLKAGIYEIKPGESITQFLEKVVAGKVMVQSFTIIEGSTLNQVIANLKQANYLNDDEPMNWQSIQGEHPNPEGLLLADTYNYNAGSAAKPLLLLANKNLQQFLQSSWESRSPGLPYQSAYELLIVASILERETSLSVEKKLISGVVVNRLKKNMPLQMDPTVIYALGANYQGKLTHDDMSIDSPYNTYRYRGLPPTPIAMVGKEAIDAAAHPQATNYLYFVAKGDGSHHFSATYEEQKKAISRYQNQKKGQ